MAKQLQCDCGFTATGPDTTEEQLQNVALQHIKDAHPDLLEQYGEEQLRAMSGNFIRDV